MRRWRWWIIGGCSIVVFGVLVVWAARRGNAIQLEKRHAYVKSLAGDTNDVWLEGEHEEGLVLELNDCTLDLARAYAREKDLSDWGFRWVRCARSRVRAEVR